MGSAKAVAADGATAAFAAVDGTAAAFPTDDVTTAAQRRPRQTGDGDLRIRAKLAGALLTRMSIHFLVRGGIRSAGMASAAGRERRSTGHGAEKPIELKSDGLGGKGTGELCGDVASPILPDACEKSVPVALQFPVPSSVKTAESTIPPEPC